MNILRATTCFIVAGLLALLALPASAPLSDMEQLGKELFFTNISAPSASMSCASCHDPATGWVGKIAGLNLRGAVYPGADRKRFGNRKPPSSAYSTYAPNFHYDEAANQFVGGGFWDGRATGWVLGNPAADQAMGPFLNPVEHNMPSKQAVCEQVAKSKHAKLFVKVWGSLDCASAASAAYDRIALSIAAYEGSTEVSPFSSKFDAYWSDCLEAGNSPDKCGLAKGAKAILDPKEVLTEQEFDGLIEYGEYCAPCHVSHVPGPNGKPPLFTDFRFDNIGVPKNPENPFYGMNKVYLDDGSPINPLGEQYIDFGLGNFLRSLAGTDKHAWSHKAAENDGKFRTPTLRNVDARVGNSFPKAYMHNGVFKSLEEVVHFYNTRDVPGKNWAAPEVPQNVNREIFEGVPLGDFQLNAEDEAAIVAFLKTLTDGWERPKR